MPWSLAQPLPESTWDSTEFNGSDKETYLQGWLPPVPDRKTLIREASKTLKTMKEVSDDADVQD